MYFRFMNIDRLNLVLPSSLHGMIYIDSSGFKQLAFIRHRLFNHHDRNNRRQTLFNDLYTNAKLEPRSVMMKILRFVSPSALTESYKLQALFSTHW